jgi:CBS domain-containing protein
VTTVGSIMTSGLLTTEPGERLQAAAGKMVERRVGAILVLDGERLAGILTERDILRAVGLGFEPDAPVSAWMTRDPDTIGTTNSIEEALVLMYHGGYRHLPVVDDDDRLAGIVSIRDLLRIGLDDATPRGV